MNSHVEKCLSTTARELDEMSASLRQIASATSSIVLGAMLTTKQAEELRKASDQLEKIAERADEAETEIQWLLGR